MPIHDFKCRACGRVAEHYIHTSSARNPPCDEPECRGDTVRLTGRFAIAFSGDISSKYLDRSKEGGHRKDGAHWVTSIRTPDGKPRHEYITTWQQQRDWARREGVTNPTDLPTNTEATSDRTLSDRGIKGQWI